MKDLGLTEQQQFDVLGGLEAILLQVFFNLLTARQGGPVLCRNTAAHLETVLHRAPLEGQDQRCWGDGLRRSNAPIGREWWPCSRSSWAREAERADAAHAFTDSDPFSPPGEHRAGQLACNTNVNRSHPEHPKKQPTKPLLLLLLSKW